MRTLNNVEITTVVGALSQMTVTNQGLQITVTGTDSYTLGNFLFYNYSVCYIDITDCYANIPSQPIQHSANCPYNQNNNVLITATTISGGSVYNLYLVAA